MQGIFHSISLIQNFVKGLEMVRNIKGWGHICDFRAKHINVLKSINLFHKIKKWNQTVMVSYTLCLMSKINTVIRIHKGLWFAGGKKMGGKPSKKYKLHVP